MPRICELKQMSGGAMWARLDIDFDGGPVSIYTPIEIKDIQDRVRREIIYAIENHDRITYAKS